MLKAGLSGYQSYLHAISLLEGLKNSDVVEIVSVFDENPKQAQRLGEVAGDVKVFTDLDGFVDSGIDFAILTGLPSKKLTEITKLASAKKHIFVDKPISGTSEDAFEITEVCKKENVKLMVAYNLHWAQSLKQAKAILQEGKLGKPLYGFYAYDGPILQETEWSKKLGWLNDRKEHMSYWFIHIDHGINLFMWLLDGMYTDVYAQITQLSNSEHDMADWGIGVLTMDNGAKVVLKCDAVTPAEFEIINIRIICEHGGLKFRYLPQSSLEVVGRHLSSNNVWKYDFKDQWPEVLPKMAEDFASFITDNRPIPAHVGGEIAGYRLMKVAEIIHKSSDLNKQLEIPLASFESGNTGGKRGYR